MGYDTQEVVQAELIDQVLVPPAEENRMGIDHPPVREHMDFQKDSECQEPSPSFAVVAKELAVAAS